MSHKTAFIKLPGFLSLLRLEMLPMSAMAAKKIVCPDGDHIEMDIEQITFNTKAPAFV